MSMINVENLTFAYDGSYDNIFENISFRIDTDCKLGFSAVQLSNRIENFSGGQKKKVLIASSLSTPAHLYVWDEPLNFIDVNSRIQIEELIEEFKPTMIFVEHDIAFQEKIATRVIQI